MNDRRSNEDLGIAIAVLRSLRGWDQKDLAEALGTSTSSISRYESGETVPPERVFEQIVAVVGLPAPQTDRLFAWLRASRAALANPTSLQNQLDVLAYQFTDHMFEVFREAAAVITQGPSELVDGHWGGGREPS
ncbi:MAG TPA: helix-turn-helix transcriptional regulator [Thermoanaerobaculia bacterium]|nr:helix-turn-helix transcriptional regulator [Thermoanaerobaculia bacterium]